MKKKRNKKIIAIYALIALALLLFVALKIYKISKHKDVNVDKLINNNVKSSYFKREKYVKKIHLIGVSRPMKNVDIKSMVSGEVLEVLFNKGDCVKKDQILIRLGNNDLQTFVEKNKTLFEEKLFNYNVCVKLHKKDNCSKNEVLRTKRELSFAKNDLESAKINASHNNIKVPFDGKIGDIYVDVGDFITSNYLITKISDDKLIFDGYASDIEVLSILKGTKAFVTLGDSVTLECSVRFVDHLPQRNTLSYLVEVDCGHISNGRTFGEVGNIFISTKPIDVFIIPFSASHMYDNGDLGVKIIKDGVVRSLTVEVVDYDQMGNIIIKDTNNYSEINLILYGHSNLKDGDIAE